MTVLGTRPEIIRLSRVMARLDEMCKHVVVHTGQNFDPQLRDVFYRELRVRPPDHTLSAQGSFSRQLATILVETERLLGEEKPDRLLILGDTNSGSGGHYRQAAGHSRLSHGGRQSLFRRSRSRRSQPSHHRSFLRRLAALHRTQPAESFARRHSRQPDLCHGQSDPRSDSPL